MDDGGYRENGRHKVDPYKTAQGQWMVQHTPSMKQVMAMMVERDAALSELNLAVAEKKAALAERDMAYLQRDAAIAERNNALSERDNAVAALPPGCQISRAAKHMHHPTHHMISDHHDPISSQQHNNHNEPVLRQRGKRAAKEPKQPGGKRIVRRVKTEECISLSVSELIGDDLGSGSGSRLSEDWKGQEMGLNQVAYDEATMPAPVCSCTGTVRQCYKWGNGGWQSSCCTTTMSLYPLPAVPNKRHARVGGRKMSGSAFNKLLSRLAAEGHDLSNSVDLKENWAKHGTNRYITIK